MTTETTETNEAIIRRFLRLPPASLPGADYVEEPGWLHPWSALRSRVSDDPEVREMAAGCGPIRMWADRDGWRDGVVVVL